MTDVPVPPGSVPPGFAPFALDSAYVRALGPLYTDGDGRLGLVTTDALANIGGVVHGGALATLADVALFVIAAHDPAQGTEFQGGVRRDCVTLTLSSSFIAPAPLGRFLIASGRVVRAGRSVVFVDGEVTEGDAVCLTFSGTLKTLRTPVPLPDTGAGGTR